MHLRGAAFTIEEKARNFVYYEALTVRDSSLSACTQAVLAAETGYLDLACDYLTEAALMDLDDLEHNTGDGLHTASLAGTWIALVQGFADPRGAHPTTGPGTAATQMRPRGVLGGPHPGAEPANPATARTATCTAARTEPDTSSRCFTTASSTA